MWDDPDARKSLDLNITTCIPSGDSATGRGAGTTPHDRDKGVMQRRTIRPPPRAFGRGELVRHLLASTATGPGWKLRRIVLVTMPPVNTLSTGPIFNCAIPSRFWYADPFKTYVQDVRSHLIPR